MRESPTTTSTASIRGIWKMSSQKKGGMKISRKGRNGKIEENPRTIRNRGASNRLKERTKENLERNQKGERNTRKAADQNRQEQGEKKQVKEHFANNKEKQQTEKEEEKDKGKDAASCTPETTPKSNDKPTKNKWDASTRRQNMLQTNESYQVQEKREESCNKFVMVDDMLWIILRMK
ncbi:uncharacterized protein [Solanum lycopersicum]|uniref:uncharacterized protein n=1 Tax=Solanum lycopersicum TaxID=4081 RepID=UPI003749BDF4